MIGAYVVYAIVLSSLIGLLAVAAEHGAIMLRRSVRGIWIAAMGAMVFAPLAIAAWVSPMRAVHNGEPALIVPISASTDIVSAHQIESAYVTSPAANRPLPVERPSLGAIWARLQHAVAPLDVWLGIAWGVLSFALGVYAIVAVRATYRLPTRLPSQAFGDTEVRVSESIGPAAIGGPNPSIVLPRWALELDTSLLDLIVRHEQEHLRARDPGLLLLALFGLVLMPWHAPLWWAWRRLRLAIEFDRDRRVLRGMSSPRVYAQLLLYIGQHGHTNRQQSVLQQLSLAVPLAIQTQGHHLRRRISAMTTRSTHRPAYLAAVIAALVLTGTLAFAIPAPRLTIATSTRVEPPVNAAAASMVKVTSLGLILTETPSSGRSALEIVIYGDGAVKVGLGIDVPTVLRDTIRLDHLPAFTADVTNGAVHVELRKVGGSMELGGSATGSPMATFTVRGRHVVLDKGATGVRVVPGAAASSTPRRTTPGRVGTPSNSTMVRDDDRRFADSVAFRIARLEGTRAKLLTTYINDAQIVLDTEQELNALRRVGRTLSAAAVARIDDVTYRLLAERRDGLRLEFERLRTKYEEDSPLVSAVAKERALLDSRMAELRATASPTASLRATTLKPSR